MRITGVEIVPVQLPLVEPFAVSYGTVCHVSSVLVRLEADGGLCGWGEATPDPMVTGETFEGVAATLAFLAPALLNLDPINRTAAMWRVDALVSGAPSARAALDIALHDLAGRAAELPVWALLGGKVRGSLTVSRVVSLKTPEEMAADAAGFVAAGFRTVKLEVGVEDAASDVRRVEAVREAVGDDVGIKVDMNQGWRTVDRAVGAARGMSPCRPEYVEQPVDRRDLTGLSEVRRMGAVPVMADEAILDARDALRAVRERERDRINIKLMKTGGLTEALTLNAVAETAGIVCQVGTMVESSVASAAGLHLALALRNAETAEMGGPLMLAADVGNLRSFYERDEVSVPDGSGLGVEPDETVVDEHAGKRVWISA